jgi:hypothetical protein
MTAEMAAKDEYSEHEASAILANYEQVRRFLHDRRLQRGYDGDHGAGKGEGKSGGKSGSCGDFARKLEDVQMRNVIHHTTCARCGEKGHWAKSFNNPRTLAVELVSNTRAMPS